MRFLFYDVETAQSTNIGSICSVGWMLYENNLFIEKGYSLIDPHCRFSEKNVSIHGITSADVAGSPSFAEYWNTVLKPFSSSAVFVAHSAKFDISATVKALSDAGIETPGIYYLDTLPLFRHFVDSPSFKLTELSKQIGFNYIAHNALEDVSALVQLLENLRDRLEFSDFAEMFLCSPVRCENTFCDISIKPARSFDAFPKKAHCKESVEAADDLLSGFRFCITGDIPGHDRADVEKRILSHGAKVTGAVSGKTDFLVVGTFDDCPSGFVSTKIKTAQALIADGGKVRIISPDELFSMMKEVI